MCPSGQTDKEHPETLADEFYQFLKSRNLLKKEPDLDPRTEWEIKARVNLQLHSNVRILELMRHDEKSFLALCKKHDPRGTFERERRVMPFVLLAECTQSAYEILKRVLLLGLDLEKTGLDRSSTYGKIISKLKQAGLDDRIVAVMDNAMRNVIAHGSWYVGNDGMFHDADGKMNLSYDDFLSRTDSFGFFANRYYDLYWREHTSPEILDFTGKKMIEDGVI